MCTRCSNGYHIVLMKKGIYFFCNMHLLGQQCRISSISFSLKSVVFLFQIRNYPIWGAVTPMKKTGIRTLFSWKNGTFSYDPLKSSVKMFTKMSKVYRENAKNRQNRGVFESAVMGVKSFLRLLFLWWMEFWKSQVSLTKRIKYLSFRTKKLLIFKVKESLF